MAFQIPNPFPNSRRRTIDLLNPFEDFDTNNINDWSTFGDPIGRALFQGLYDEATQAGAEPPEASPTAEEMTNTDDVVPPETSDTPEGRAKIVTGAALAERKRRLALRGRLSTMRNTGAAAAPIRRPSLTAG